MNKGALKNQSLFIGNSFVFATPKISLSSSVGFELALAISEAKKRRKTIYNDLLAYQRKLADIEDQYLFLSSEIESGSSLENNAAIMTTLVFEFTEISTIVTDLDLELVELDKLLQQAEERLSSKSNKLK
ncbi:MAG: hypothetical protein WAQ98_25695 [Blastocatellia bacterium]